MIVSREVLVAAIIHWGEKGAGGEPGLAITKESSKLVDVLATMDFQKEATASLSDGSERAKLILESEAVRKNGKCEVHA